MHVWVSLLRLCFSCIDGVLLLRCDPDAEAASPSKPATQRLSCQEKLQEQQATTGMLGLESLAKTLAQLGLRIFALAGLEPRECVCMVDALARGAPS